MLGGFIIIANKRGRPHQIARTLLIQVESQRPKLPIYPSSLFTYECYTILSHEDKGRQTRHRWCKWPLTTGGEFASPPVKSPPFRLPMSSMGSFNECLHGPSLLRSYALSSSRTAFSGILVLLFFLSCILLGLSRDYSCPPQRLCLRASLYIGCHCSWLFLYGALPLSSPMGSFCDLFFVLLLYYVVEGCISCA